MPNLNALAPIESIQTHADFVNQYLTKGTGRVNPEIFYAKQVLDTIRIDADQYCYYRLADAMPIQERADKLKIRRWSALQAHTTPLAEGIPPQSDKASVVSYELEAFQYGRYMEFTDQVDFKVVDPILMHYTKEYSLVAIETMDLLARDTLLMHAQRYYAGGALNYDALDFTNAVPSMQDLRKIGLTMKKNLVKPRNNGKFHVIASANFYFDMFEDPLVQKYMEYTNTVTPMYNAGQAPLPPMFEFEFYESLCVPQTGEYVDNNGKKRLKYFIPGATPTISKSTGGTQDLNEDNAAQYKVEPGYMKDPTTGQDASYFPDMKTWTLPNNAVEFKVEHVLILGKDALARTGLAGEDSVKVYTKPLGSAGVLDPIDQRQSIGFKINSIGFGTVRAAAIWDYLCVPTQTNA